MIKGITCLGIDLSTGLGLGELPLLQSSPKYQRLLTNEANKQNKSIIESKKTPKIK